MSGEGRMAKEMSAAKRAAGLTFNVSGFAVERDALQLMAMVPQDTRNLTQRFFGDPMPERSALYRRTQSEAGS